MRLSFKYGTTVLTGMSFGLAKGRRTRRQGPDWGKGFHEAAFVHAPFLRIDTILIIGC
jgi:hypothetical protein